MIGGRGQEQQDEEGGQPMQVEQDEEQTSAADSSSPATSGSREGQVGDTEGVQRQRVQGVVVPVQNCEENSPTTSSVNGEDCMQTEAGPDHEWDPDPPVPTPTASSPTEPTVAVVGGIPDSFKSELYFLVTRFLQGDPRTQAAAEVLKADLDKGNLLTPRYDWKGRPHHKTFDEVCREGRMPPHQHLLSLCFKLSSLGVSSASAGSPTSGFACRGPATMTLLGRHPALDPILSGVQPPSSPHCLVSMCHRQFGLSAALSPSVTSRSLNVLFSRRLRRLRRTLGHLSAVYCLLFDRTGRFVFTGADDLLVKCWQVRDGRLVFTFRGASSEISDLAVSHDNRLLAAGSCDKIIRVWCLRTAAPVAVLTKHTGMITAVNFCPVSLEDNSFHLASTSGDGTVSFWRYR